ncbi:MAG: Fic family protein [Bacteroidetes bacterium]|nr:Fic family protein [Bacteroidota bacterium]
MKRHHTYIHQLKNWPNFTIDHEHVLPLLSRIRMKQGQLLGKMKGIGFDLQEQTTLQNLTLDITKSGEIEGEFLNPELVRSSVARRLGIATVGLKQADRHTDGVVEMMLDATQHFEKPIGKERLCGWQAALFPTGRSGLYKIVTGDYRKDETGPMQVVSGALGKEKVHFEAPAAKLLTAEMKNFMKWFNAKEGTDAVLKAAIAHLWFITIHPFDDGNGRVARTLTDMLLARADGMKQRFYSMSAQILLERKAYYDMLERTQKGTLDITPWVAWFLKCLHSALQNSEQQTQSIFEKAKFWEAHKKTHFNPRQIKMMNKCFDGLDGKLSTTKWAKMNKCSPDTALRDIQDLIEKKVLKKETGGGRSTGYVLKGSSGV